VRFYTVDRFEGTEWVVLEDERARSLQVPRNWLPGDVREGDVISASVGAGQAPALFSSSSISGT